MLFTNHVNDRTIDFPFTDNARLRVWSERASHSNLELFNVEWTPYVKIDAHHTFDLTEYPLDTQTIKIRIDSWMSQSERGRVALKKLKYANENVTTDIDIEFEDDERFKIVESSGEMVT